MTRRFFGRTGLILVAAAAMLPLASSAKADSPVCCSDVKFPTYYREHGPAGPYLVVDPDGYGRDDVYGRGRGVYATIQEALSAAHKNADILVKPHPQGYYDLDEPLRITKPVTITSFGGAPIVRIRAPRDGSCATVNVRREGKVTLNGLMFEARGSGPCIDVQRAAEFALTGSSIVPLGSAVAQADRCVPSGGGRRPPGGPLCGAYGVVVQSGAATIQGNQIRRMGTAVAILSAVGEAHSIQGNYLAGNAVGIYVDNGARVVIERNGIFKNYLYGVQLESAAGLVADNDIEDNRTGLRIVPPSNFLSPAAAMTPNGVPVDYADLSAPTISVERNLVTQFGSFSRNARADDWVKQQAVKETTDTQLATLYDQRAQLIDRVERHDKFTYRERRNYRRELRKLDKQIESRKEELADMQETNLKTVGEVRGDPAGYAIEFGLFDGFLEDEVYDYPKKGAVLANILIRQNCFFGPTKNLFDKDQWMPLIKQHNTTVFGLSGGDVERVDYDGVDKIDAENSIRNPLFDGFSGSTGRIIHNFFARNDKPMECTFRFSEPVVGSTKNFGKTNRPPSNRVD